MIQKEPGQRGEQPQTGSSILWRKIIDAVSDYESHLQDAMRLTPEDFASKYTDIPSDILTPELHRLKEELEADDPRNPSACIEHQRYAATELLSCGGMGEIYRGFDNDCQRPVAIKIIRREFQNDSEAKRRFHAEAELTASLEHPGVIPIYGRGIDPKGRDFYAMRLISGGNSGTFSQSIRNFHSHSFPNATEQSRHLRDLIGRLVDIADTIAYAHHQNIVHRDLKPSNILIGPYGETLIADWGLARRIDQPNSIHQDWTISPQESNVAPGNSATPGLGTPGYAAPDIHSGSSEVSLRSADIYSLGAILVCILTNQPPSPANTVDFNFKGIPRIGALQAIADKATATHWHQRYDSVEAFRSDLLMWIAGEPVLAMPESWLEQATRWPSRHPKAATGLATAVACALLGGTFFLANQTKQNRIVVAQAKNLQIALNDSASLLKQTQQANLIAENRRIEAEKNRQLAEKREALAFDGLLKFQNLLATNDQIFQSPQFASLNDTLSDQSKETLDAILNVLDQDLSPSPNSVSRLEYITRRIAAMDASLGKHNQAHELIDLTCTWINTRLEGASKLSQIPEATQDAMRLRVGQLRTLQGSLEMRRGHLTEAKPRYQAAVELIEPLLLQHSLDDQDSLTARLALMDALSGLSMHEAFHGDPNQAKRLQQQAIDWIGNDPPRSNEEAITRMQIHGNMSILHQRAGETTEALKQLELAAMEIENAMGTIDENPAGFATDQSIVIPTKELISARARVAHQRANILIANQNAAEAIPILKELIKKETLSLEQTPINPTLVGLYESTATLLQLLLLNNGDIQAAIYLSEDWMAIAEKLVTLPEISPVHWNMIINAYHSAGHMYEQMAQNDLAIENYDRAIQICSRALERNQPPSGILLQRIDLLSHQFQLLATCKPVDQIQKYYEDIVSTASELAKLPPNPKMDVGVVKHRLEQGLGLIQEKGSEELAHRWEQKLKDSGLLP